MRQPPVLLFLHDRHALEQVGSGFGSPDAIVWHDCEAVNPVDQPAKFNLLRSDERQKG